MNFWIVDEIYQYIVLKKTISILINTFSNFLLEPHFIAPFNLINFKFKHKCNKRTNKSRQKNTY